MSALVYMFVFFVVWGWGYKSGRHLFGFQLQTSWLLSWRFLQLLLVLLILLQPILLLRLFLLLQLFWWLQVVLLLLHCYRWCSYRCLGCCCLRYCRCYCRWWWWSQGCTLLLSLLLLLYFGDGSSGNVSIFGCLLSYCSQYHKSRRLVFCPSPLKKTWSFLPALSEPGCFQTTYNPFDSID